MKVILPVLLLFLCSFSLAQAQDPPRYEFPDYLPKKPRTLSQVSGLFDPSQCLTGYIIRGGQIDKDFYFVLDCLDNAALEKTN